MTKYNKFSRRIIYFIFYSLILIIMQYAVNVFIMRNMCQEDANIDFKTLNIYTIGLWLIGLLMIFGILYKMPKFKGVYSNTLVHRFIKMVMTPKTKEVYKGLFKNIDDIENPKLKMLVQKINCHHLTKKEIEEVDNEKNYDKYCSSTVKKETFLFLNNINTSNFKEYLKILEPIINSNSNGEIQFIKLLIKKDIISEMVWILKIGLLILFAIYQKLKSAKCLNHKEVALKTAASFVKDSVQKCKIEEDKTSEIIQDSGPEPEPEPETEPEPEPEPETEPEPEPETETETETP